MGTVNRVVLVGNLVSDAKLHRTAQGAPVTTVSLATSEIWRDKGGERHEQAEFHRVVIWGRMAESLEPYLYKGKQVYAEGRLQTRKWADKDGVTHYTTEVRADRVVLLGGPDRRRDPEPADALPDEAPLGGSELPGAEEAEW